MKRVKPFWIKQRYNPQLGTYYVPEGQMSKTAAKRYERPLYGDACMHRYETKSDYNTALDKLRKDGEKVH